MEDEIAQQIVQYTVAIAPAIAAIISSVVSFLKIIKSLKNENDELAERIIKTEAKADAAAKESARTNELLVKYIESQGKVNLQEYKSKAKLEEYKNGR